MKKLLSIILVVILAFSMVACGEKEEHKINPKFEELYDITQWAIQVTDDYLSAKITSSEAVEKLEVLYERAEAEHEEIDSLDSISIVTDILDTKIAISDNDVVKVEEQKNRLESHFDGE